jgi:hypothetical protein
VDPELLEALGEGGGSLPVHERLNRYHAARELRLKMLRAQRDYEELLGFDFQPHLVSSPRVRERAAARHQQQRARSLSPGRLAGGSGSGSGSGSSGGSPARARTLASSATHGALPTLASLSVFDRLALEGRDRIVRRREGRGSDDPECTFRPRLYTGGSGGAVRSPSAASSVRSGAVDDDRSLGSAGSSSVG